jgi:hypothetical protein
MQPNKRFSKYKGPTEFYFTDMLGRPPSLPAMNTSTNGWPSRPKMKMPGRKPKDE